MFTSGRSEMVTRIVGDINATLVRKLEDLEHRVLMRIENLQRYEEATMSALSNRVDALERASSSLRFQNEMIQDELDELERLMLREFTQNEMSRTIASTCKVLTQQKEQDQTAAGQTQPTPKADGTSDTSKKHISQFAQKFGKRIFEKQQQEKKKSQIMQRFAESFANKIVTEKSDVLEKAANIAKHCGSPTTLNHKRKLLKALVLHMAARIITEQKLRVQRSREAKDKAEKIGKLNTEFTKSFVKRYIESEREKKTKRSSTPSPPRSGRPRHCSDHSSSCGTGHSQSMYDLNQYAYHGNHPKSRRLFSKPLRVFSPEPNACNFNVNVQRRPWSAFGGPRAKSASPERGNARYRFPTLKRYTGRDKNLIDLKD